MRGLLFLIFLLISPAAFAQQAGYTLDQELLYRINFGRADDVKILLDKGANPNAVSDVGEYALSIAIGREDSESAPIVRALLDKGANPNMYDKSNVYPIVNAVMSNKPLIVSNLMEKGADFHVKSPNGRTLIEIAKANNFKEMEKLLQDQIDKEAALNASLHSTDRFHQLINNYYLD